MAELSIFYSWQSDLPRKVARDFIHIAAENAVNRIGASLGIEDAPRLENAAEGVSGSPPIGDTILGRIDRCAVFLADVSLVGETLRPDKAKKRMPNPNVLIETGYEVDPIPWTADGVV